MPNTYATIRPAKPSDAEALVELIREHAAYEKEIYDPAGKIEKIRECLTADPQPFTCLVVDTSDGIQGYCAYMSQYDSWYGEPHMSVDALFLREHMRGASIGRALMEKVKEEAKRLGYSTVRLMTPSDNTRAIKFYERIGGQPAAKLWFWFQL